MAAAISVLSPKSTTALQSLDLLKQPNFEFLSGSPLEGFSLNLKPGGGSGSGRFSSYPKFPIVERHYRNATKVYATRRRRSNMETDAYVLMEPGKAEEFVTEEELRVRLKGWLENWPATSLPPDLAIFESIDDAVSHLVKLVCELEIDGDVGSIQWYQVRLE
ncbi:hypothetical protein L6452_10791 [Arctium lappa]|uniref:Uncharacterized protein n=1 Tax=Arctium lappa TaxID=4217 RepID=A0ACB9DNU3_ARCLA|nr:hypothetical protein L6452_10791 [Arctium lappa]